MSLNKVILIGRLGRDPETRYMANGDAVCNFSIATSESWQDKNSGQRVEKTEWHNITLYRRLGEIAAQYLKKGSQVYIEGKIQSRKYTDKTGVERTAYEIIGSEMKMLDTRSSSGGGAPYEDGGYQQGAPRPQAAPQNYQNNQANYANNQNYAPQAPAHQGYEQPAEVAPPKQQMKAPTAPVEPKNDIGGDDIPF